eukprot:GEMP01083303.1.p1 GENE.GEMP01083303.1~~GEMP01083303.1.p1  ORF type:complete len:157 (+),score=18.76 GEMP01083303.1:16-486(+)
MGRAQAAPPSSVPDFIRHCMVETVAFIDRNNEPILVDIFGHPGTPRREDVEYEIALCAALDQVPAKRAKNPQDPFVGLIGEPWANGSKIYGYVSYTQTKVLLCVSDEYLGDVASIRLLCRKLMEVYKKAICAPSVGPVVVTKMFTEHVRLCLGKEV